MDKLIARQGAELDRLRRKRLAPYRARLVDARHDFALSVRNTPELAGVTWFYILTPDGATALADGWAHPGVRNTFLDKYAVANGLYLIADDAAVSLRGTVAWACAMAGTYGLAHVFAYFTVPQ